MPGVDIGSVLSRAPSLLAYTPEVLERKVGELGELFGDRDIAAMLRREPALLTYNVRINLASKVAVYERELPGVDVRKLLASTPRLLSYNVPKTLPAKLESLRSVLPGADVPRLVRNVPQLLEFDVEGSLAPKLLALRSLFHPTAAGAPPPTASPAQRLATSKLLAARRPGRSPRSRGGRSTGRVASKAASARQQLGSGGRPMSTVGLLRLAALDTSVVEARLGRLTTLLPEVDTIALVSKQPSLLRRDVDGSLRPRLLFISSVLEDPTEAAVRVAANPRLLMSSWGVLARLVYVINVRCRLLSLPPLTPRPLALTFTLASPSLSQHVPGATRTISVSTTIMTPKKGFAERFPGYTGWLRAQIEHVAAVQMADAAGSAIAADGGSSWAGVPAAWPAAKLEAQLGEMLEERVAAGAELGRESFARDVLRRRAASADSNGGESDDERE